MFIIPKKTVRKDETSLVNTIKLIPKPELTQIILSYGADVKVLKPESLKESICAVEKSFGSIE